MLYAVLSLLLALLFFPMGFAFAQEGLNTTSSFGLIDSETLSIISLTSLYDLNKWAEVEQKMDDGFNIIDVVTTSNRTFVILGQ